jgi:hypothetical protein
MSDHFQKEIAFLGIESSPASVRAPEGNGFWCSAAPEASIRLSVPELDFGHFSLSVLGAPRDFRLSLADAVESCVI